MTVFGARDFDDHELVEYVCDQRTGLRAIIALHRALPRAAGGIRMKAYLTEAEALRDALRLSRAMTNKWAFAGIRRGGGKTVIIGDPERHKTPDLLRALGRAIEALGGRYYAGADSGTSSKDMEVIQEVTSFVRGADRGHGDTSEATAYGVVQGILAGVKEAYGRDDLEKIIVAVQGVGHVGAWLCQLLAERGARLIVADIDPRAAAAMQERYGARAVGADAILSAEADVLAPCALGDVIDVTSAATITAPVICGAANNQLASDTVARILEERRLLFVPDYVVNSGGILNALAEGPAYDRDRVWRRLERIYDDCIEVFQTAKTRGMTPLQAADLIGRRRLEERSSGMASA